MAKHPPCSLLPSLLLGTRRRFTFSYKGEVPEQLITVLTNKPKSGAPVLVSVRPD